MPAGSASRAVARHRALVDGVLGYARQETDVPFAPVDIGALTADVLGAITAAPRAEGGTVVRFRLPAEVPAVASAG